MIRYEWIEANYGSRSLSIGTEFEVTGESDLAPGADTVVTMGNGGGGVALYGSPADLERFAERLLAKVRDQGGQRP